MEPWMRVPFWSGLATVVAGSVMGGVMMLAPSGTAATGQAEAPRSSTAECTKANLSAKYKGGDAATSHVYGQIVLRNTSEKTCYVKGYGGLSYVGKGNGTQIGAAADRTPSATPKTVLKPGDKVRSAIVETSFAPYPKKECRPTKVDGFRVYVPDETRSIFIEHPTTGCANPEVHLLQHKAYR
jgi:hypothetical protein